MVVEGQNPNIGTRNVHFMRPGGNRSVGGRGSGFLIFAYRLPGHVADLSRSGDSYTFTPVKQDRCGFEHAVTDCLNRQIVLLSDEGRQVRVKFRKYVSRLEQINRIMHLTDRPGLPGDWDE